jgi:hypothetical protein
MTCPVRTRWSISAKPRFARATPGRSCLTSDQGGATPLVPRASLTTIGAELHLRTSRQRKTKGLEAFLKLRNSEADKVRCRLKHLEMLGVPLAVLVSPDEPR